jgi:hypothetical protein
MTSTEFVLTEAGNASGHTTVLESDKERTIKLLIF